ncbi:MAG: type II toxin-antitoxin system RelE/ParE family toxin [Paludibacter sp.]|nr:type II toxin-antitoxin system RelE/ParE family toxin [Paludibacter sp.]
MSGYRLTTKAVEDLTEIWNYTFEVWSESQADRYYELLVDNFSTIAGNPYIGKRYNVIKENLYALLAGKHLIFYRIVAGCEIEIVRILHQQMDIKSKI